jgi:hypothetical protein
MLQGIDGDLLADSHNILKDLLPSAVEFKQSTVSGRLIQVSISEPLGSKPNSFIC